MSKVYTIGHRMVPVKKIEVEFLESDEYQTEPWIPDAITIDRLTHAEDPDDLRGGDGEDD